RVIRLCQPTWLDCHLFQVLPSSPLHIASRQCTTCQLYTSATTVCSGLSPVSPMRCQAHKRINTNTVYPFFDTYFFVLFLGFLDFSAFGFCFCSRASTISP